MKTLKMLFAILVISHLITFESNAQKNYAKNADIAFKNAIYTDAVGLYKIAYSKVTKYPVEKARIIYQIAECYRLLNDRLQAETWYKKAIAANYPEPLAILHYADMLKMNEKYDEAIIQYNAYSALVPSDVRGANGAESTIRAQQWKDNPTSYKVENELQFNSIDMDFATTYYDDKYKQILFTSTKEGTKGGSDLWLSVQDRNGTWSTTFSLGENINTKYNEGAACLNDKCNELYFTRCTNENNKQTGCQIFISKKRGVSWDIPESIVIDTDSFSYGQPSLSIDELTLYFSSDMDGGYGGKDIWMVQRIDKYNLWGKPINLGSTINTEGDEMYPFIRDDGTLYFSSDGLLGMGGLDIFKVDKVGNKWGIPVNMKYPINSASDDFAIVFESDNDIRYHYNSDSHVYEIVFEGKLEKGYLSSNRKGGIGSDDIYSFYQPTLICTLSGSICNDSSITKPKEIIKGAVVSIIGSDGNSISDTTDDNGFYKFSKTQFLPNTYYDIIVEARGYFCATGKENTEGLEGSKDFMHDFCLIPIPTDPLLLPDILFVPNDYKLLPQYQDSLNTLIKIMEDYPKFVIEVGAYTDSRGSIEYNNSLSYKRALSVIDYLISKGIAARKLVPYGYGESLPRTLFNDFKSNEYVFPKGITLTDEYIDQFKLNSKKYEAAQLLNNRVEFRILSDDNIDTLNNDYKYYKIGVVSIDNRKGDKSSLSSNKIPLVKVGNRYKIKVKLNDNDKMSFDFILDTGADEVLVSSDIFMTFYKGGLIKDADINNLSNYSIADGSIVTGLSFTLKKLQIGNVVLSNIAATVIEGSDECLLGGSLLNKFGKYTIDTENSQLILGK